MRWVWRSEGGGTSRTGQAVALWRAELDRPHSPAGDPNAQRALCWGMRPVGASGHLRHIAARTQFFDGQVQEAVAKGIGQVVICGAGYDDRALRFRQQDVAFFELDHRDTQADKARKLQAMGADLTGLTLAVADFRTDDVAAVLDRSGHDACRPTLFVCEGLLVYLSQQDSIGLLAGLAARASAGSVLAASLATHAAGLDSDRVVAATNAARRAGRSEPWLTILPRDTQLGLLARGRWEVRRAIDAAEVDPELDPDRTLLVTASPTGSAGGFPRSLGD